MSKKIEDGKVDVLGINIDISQVLGTKIIDQYMAQLKEEDIKMLMNYITKDLFTTTYNGSTIVKERTKNTWGDYIEKSIPIGELIKNQFNERIKEELKKKVEEIIATTDYQKKIDEIANELVEYVTNGYKEDMKARIRERLVGNVINTEPYYTGESLTSIINKIIDERIRH